LTHDTARSGLCGSCHQISLYLRHVMAGYNDKIDNHKLK